MIYHLGLIEKCFKFEMRENENIKSFCTWECKLNSMGVNYLRQINPKILNHFVTPPRNRGGVIFALQLISLCVSVCLSVGLWPKVSKFVRVRASAVSNHLAKNLVQIGAFVRLWLCSPIDKHTHTYTQTYKLHWKYNPIHDFVEV